MSRWQLPWISLPLTILIGLAVACIIFGLIVPNWTLLVDILKPRLDYHWLGDSTLPVRLAWEFKADDLLRSPPIIGEDGTVYVEAGKYIYALDPDTGTVKWHLRVSRKLLGIILPVDDLVLVTTDADEVLQALRAEDGQVVWQVSVDELTHDLWPFFIAPSINHLSADEQRIYVGLNLGGAGHALALDPATGQLLWTSEANADGPTHMSSAPRQLIIDGRRLIFVDKETGTVVRSEINDPSSFDPPLYMEETVYTNGETARAIALDTLAEKWRIKPGCPGRNPSISEPPEVVDNVAYLLSSCHLVYAVNVENGRLLWRYSDENKRKALSFVVYRDIGYLLTTDAVLHAVDLETGREVGQLMSIPDTLPFQRLDYLAADDKLLFLHYGGYQLFAFSAKEDKPERVEERLSK